MHTAARKLHSQRGASMLFALLVFFLCLLAGVAALTAAAANIGRYTHLEGEQQQYFSVASALDLLQKQLNAIDPADADPITITVKCVDTYWWWYEKPDSATPEAPLVFKEYRPDKEYQWVSPAPTGAAVTLTYFQNQLLQNGLPPEWQTGLTNSFTTVNTSTDTPKNYTITLTPPDVSPADTLFPVSVVATNCTDAGAGPYALEMQLTAKNGTGAYPLKVVWSGEPDIDTKTETVTGSTATTALPLTIPGMTVDKVVGEVGKRTTTTTLTCTLRWSADNRVVTFLNN